MTWEPDEKAWAAYIALEMRYRELDRASAIWERAVTCHPEPRQWIKWAKFEEDRSAYDQARRVFTMALEFFGEDEDRMEKAQTIYTAFAKMETRLKEYDRARVIYKYALERLPRSKSQGIYSSYTRFEKQFGTREGVEDTVLGKRRIEYEEELSNSTGGGSSNYDTWFDYTRLEEDAYRALVSSGIARDAKEASAAISRVRDVYERAIANVPPSTDKRHWRRYIFLWLNYALFEEIDTRDFDRAREVYKAAVALVPHKSFTFAKLWLQFANFEIRRLQLTAARKLLGTSIGMCPKEKLFKGYIDLELSLKEFDRARKIYERALDWDPANSRIWIRFAELERELFDCERARAIYALGIQQAAMEMPEVLWKSFIDFEFEEREWDRVDELYEKLLTRTGHVKVWVSYAMSQIQRAIALDDEEDDDEDNEEDGEAVKEQKEPKVLTEEEMQARALRRNAAKTKARDIFERGYKDLKSRGLKEERVVLLEAWKSFEAQHGATPEELASGVQDKNAKLKEVEAKMPRVVKKRRQVVPGDEGSGMEEYYDMLFPDDEEGKAKQPFKLLAMAHAWRQQQLQQLQQQQQQQQQGDGQASSEPSSQGTNGHAQAQQRDSEEAQEEIGPVRLDEGDDNGNSCQEDVFGADHPGLGTTPNGQKMHINDEM